MAKYRVLAKSFIGNTIVEEGTIVECDGPVDTNLEPLDGSEVDPKAANIESMARMKVAAVGGNPSDGEAVATVNAAASAAEQAVASQGLI